MIIRDGIVWYEFEYMAKTGLVNHCFTTRIDSVSIASQDTMNITYHASKYPGVVAENFRRLGTVVGFDPEKGVRARQSKKITFKLLLLIVRWLPMEPMAY